MKDANDLTDAAGTRRRNRAIDAATEVFACRCHKPECEIAQLVSFRDHLAFLFNALVECEQTNLLPSFTSPDGSVYTWHAVSYALQMAAGLEEVDVNTAYVDVLNSWMMCGSAADFDDAHSLVAAQYFAAAITFNFVWNAYEAAVRVASTTNFIADTTAVRGRKHAAVITSAGRRIPVLAKLTRGADKFCRLGGGLDPQHLSRATDLNSRGLPAEAAAELARLLRNHIAHGCDEVPLPRDWGDEATECGRIYRIYAVARILVMLIQLFAVHALSDPNQLIYCSWYRDEEEQPAFEVLTNLHLRLSEYQSTP